MANVKATMTEIKVIIREFYRGTSLREIERKLKLSRTSLRNYRSRDSISLNVPPISLSNVPPVSLLNVPPFINQVPVC